LKKYGDYRYQYWEGFSAENVGNISFEARITYKINNVEQTQCESYTIPVLKLETFDMTEEFTLSHVTFSRSRIFIIEGTFSEDLYNQIGKDFKATFRTEHLEDPTLLADIALKQLNKVVCVGSICSFRGEVNLPRNRLDNYTVYNQWCDDEFKRSLIVERGVAQPFYVEMVDTLLTTMCNKLGVGI